MPHKQSSQHHELEEGLQSQIGAPGLVGAQCPADEKEEAASSFSSSSSTPIQSIPEEVPAAGSPHPSQSPQGASSPQNSITSTQGNQFDEGLSSQEEEWPSTSPDPVDAESLLQEALDGKMAHLVHFLLHKYQKKEPITKAEMLSAVIKNDEEYFPAIFSKASECMRLVFGIDLKEIDPTNHSYVLVNSVGLSYDGMLGNDQSKPKVGLLIMVLGMIFMEGNHAPEEVIWEALSVMGVYVGKNHFIFGEARKLLTQDWVQEAYLEFRQVPGSDPARYEFLWGPRAHAETSKMKVLEHVAKINGRDLTSYPSLYEEALREMRERESEQELQPGPVAGTGPGHIPGLPPAASPAPSDGSILHPVFEGNSQHSK
ncbi:melanoma-associated antigen 8-like [Carlito syrichta]|uniref:Melanoma-associated antigen 8-like n=1 Tax=Carlito syrichta TaxID=1868482 RepID=A0A3Q0DHD8_CARSF|nr:melanoma-associated antigen 8-like [Carlito syrichta]